MFSALSFPSFGVSARCRGCDHPRPPYNGGYASVRSSLGTMLSNAKYIGCEVCAVLSDGILAFLADNSCGVTREDVDSLQLDFNLAGSRRSLEVMLLNTPVKLSFFVSKATPWLTENLPDVPVGKEVPATTASDESLAWAVQQLQHCQKSHKECNSFPPAPLPSRVLDVLAKGGNGVCLYVSRGETVPYVALSHCWGHKPFLRTLSGSLEAHKSEITWERLPQSFQDAIVFTRHLGIRYLWIDSLCIVQDDQHDWRREAAKMASVYQGADLVISAARSDGAYGGLYADVPDTHKTHTISFVPGYRQRNEDDDYDDGDDNHPSSPSAPPQTLHLRHSLAHTHRLLSPYHPQTTTLLPIFTRAWVLQERFLSPRLLHFGPHELSFECLASTTCQCTPQPEPTTTSAAAEAAQPAWYTNLLTRTTDPKKYYSYATWRDGSLSKGELQVCWRRLVEDYSRLGLTVEGDVFPAVGGMARLMGKVRGTKYLAGCWEESLLVGDLVWRVDLPVTAAEASGEESREERWRARARPLQWRAPSWSWAAVKMPVEFVSGDEGVEAACEVVEVACEPVGVDLMGELKEGGSWLVVKGRLIPARLRFKDPEEPQPWNVIDLDILDGHVKNLWADDDCRGLLTAEGEQPQVYCLLVGRKLPRKEVLCLVLTRVPEDERGSAASQDRGEHEDGHLYRRIAMLEIFGGPPSPVLWGWVHNLLGQGEDALVRIV